MSRYRYAGTATARRSTAIDLDDRAGRGRRRRRRRTTPASRRSASWPPAWRPATIGGRLEGPVTIDGARRRRRSSPTSSRSAAAILFQNPVDAAVGHRPRPSGRRSRSGRATSGCRSTRSSSASTRRSAALAHRRPRRARPAAAVGRPGPARGARGGAGAAAGLPRPRRADQPARPAGHAARRRGAGAAVADDRAPGSCSSSTRPTCSRAIADGSSSSPTAGSSLDGRRGRRARATRGWRTGRGAAVGGPAAAAAAGRGGPPDPASWRAAWPRGIDRTARRDRHRRRARRRRLRLPGRHAGARRTSTCTIRPGERVAIVGQNGSRQVDAGAPLQRPASSRPRARSRVDGEPIGGRATSPSSRALVGIAFQNPDRQIFAGRVRRRGRVRAAEPRAVAARRSMRRVERGPGRGRASTEDATRTRTTSAISRRKLLATRVGPGDGARRSWSSTSRRPARTRAASRGSSTIVGRPGGRRADGDRDQPRHAVRGRDVRAGRRHARRPDRAGRHAGGGLRRGELADARVDVPRAAARGPGRRAAGLGSTPTEDALVAALAARG